MDVQIDINQVLAKLKLKIAEDAQTIAMLQVAKDTLLEELRVYKEANLKIE